MPIRISNTERHAHLAALDADVLKLDGQLAELQTGLAGALDRQRALADRIAGPEGGGLIDNAPADALAAQLAKDPTAPIDPAALDTVRKNVAATQTARAVAEAVAGADAQLSNEIAGIRDCIAAAQTERDAAWATLVREAHSVFIDQLRDDFAAFYATAFAPVIAFASERMPGTIGRSTIVGHSGPRITDDSMIKLRAHSVPVAQELLYPRNTGSIGAQEAENATVIAEVRRILAAPRKATKPTA